jgi:hypothetical protein
MSEAAKFAVILYILFMNVFVFIRRKKFNEFLKKEKPDLYKKGSFEF